MPLLQCFCFKRTLYGLGTIFSFFMFVLISFWYLYIKFQIRGFTPSNFISLKVFCPHNKVKLEVPKVTLTPKTMRDSLNYNVCQPVIIEIICTLLSF